MVKVVGIGEFVISNNLDDILKTYALASCVAVVVYSPFRKVAGLIHVALPAAVSREDEKSRPAYYAQTGVPLMIDSICRSYGCLKGELMISLYGGARSIRRDDLFHIGVRNLEEVKRQFMNIGLKYQAKDIGGTVSRTVEIDVATGNIKVYTQPICF